MVDCRSLVARLVCSSNLFSQTNNFTKYNQQLTTNY